LAEGAKSVEEIANKVRGLFEDDGLGEAGLITCSSVHKAKGLEANRVFILMKTIRYHSQEERNIAYVAIDRDLYTDQAVLDVSDPAHPVFLMVLDNSGGDYMRGFRLFYGKRPAAALTPIPVDDPIDAQYPDGRIAPVHPTRDILVQACKPLVTRQGLASASFERGARFTGRRTGICGMRFRLRQLCCQRSAVGQRRQRLRGRLLSAAGVIARRVEALEFGFECSNPSCMFGAGAGSFCGFVLERDQLGFSGARLSFRTARRVRGCGGIRPRRFVNCHCLATCGLS
jgi:hypothetical protein